LSLPAQEKADPESRIRACETTEFLRIIYLFGALLPLAVGGHG